MRQHDYITIPSTSDHRPLSIPPRRGSWIKDLRNKHLFDTNKYLSNEHPNQYWDIYNVLQSASFEPCNCTQRFMIIGLINGSIVILTMFLKFKMSKQQQEKHVSKCTLVLNTCSICNLRRLA